MRILIVMSIFIGLIALIGGARELLKPVETAAPFLNGIGGLFCGICLLLGAVLEIRKGKSAALLYVSGWGFLLVPQIDRLLDEFFKSYVDCKGISGPCTSDIYGLILAASVVVAVIAILTWILSTRRQSTKTQ